MFSRHSFYNRKNNNYHYSNISNGSKKTIIKQKHPNHNSNYYLLYCCDAGGGRHYTTAILRGVPNTLSHAISMSSPVEPISIERAIQQHITYSSILRSTVPRLIEIDADDAYPDCVFIEDTAIVIDGKAVITRIGVQSRQGEVDATKEVLLSLGLQVHDMRSAVSSPSTTFSSLDELTPDDYEITCDGGDVLYPVTYLQDGKSCHLPFEKRGGKHLFVGISERTNIAGVKYLEKVFSDIEIIPVDLMSALFHQDDDVEAVGGRSGGGGTGKILHLKSIVTHLDHDTLLLPTGRIGDELCDRMGAKERGYKVIRLPDIAACNVVSIQGKIVMAQPCISQQSKEILNREVVEKRGMVLHFVDASEFSKCDGALTCKSILIP